MTASFSYPDLRTILNPEQYTAATLKSGTGMIIAGPGTGKTHTLIYRIIYLLSQIDDREKILAVTFTRRAGEEIKQRLEKLGLPEVKINQVTISTIHSLCLSILHRNQDKTSEHLPENWTIASRIEQEELMKQALQKNNLEVTDSLTKDLLTILTHNKNLCFPLDYIPQKETEKLRYIPLKDIFNNYQNLLQENRLLDYDDLLLKTYEILTTNIILKQKYQNYWQYVLVDEFQDISEIQYRLLLLLVEQHKNYWVIGDPNQSIYGFRGASSDNFLKIKQTFPQIQEITLLNNYRSTPEIINTATQVINQINSFPLKPLKANQPSGRLVNKVPTASPRAEAEFVVKTIEQLLGATTRFSLDSNYASDEGNDYSFADFAVLFRTSAQSEPIEEALHRLGYPYQKASSVPLTSRRSVNLLTSYIETLVRPEYTSIWLKIINQPARGLGPETIKKMQQEADKEKVPLAYKLANKKSFECLTSKSREALEDFYNICNEINIHYETKGLVELVNYLKNLFFPSKNALAAEEQLALDYFIMLSHSFPKDAKGFLAALSLYNDIDGYKSEADSISLLTLHAAKGLEFPVVFIIGCEEGLLPYREDQTLATNLEEECRLLYVGMTRARERLYLTFTKQRTWQGQTCPPTISPFLKALEPKQIHLISDFMISNKKKVKAPEEKQLNLF